MIFIDICLRLRRAFGRGCACIYIHVQHIHGIIALYTFTYCSDVRGKSRMIIIILPIYFNYKYKKKDKIIQVVTRTART